MSNLSELVFSHLGPDEKLGLCEKVVRRNLTEKLIIDELLQEMEKDSILPQGQSPLEWLVSIFKPK